MAANIYVYCLADTEAPSRCDLQRALEGFFGEAADECGAGTGNAGFNLDYELAAGEDPHAWADRLTLFLAGIPVRPRTTFDVFPDGWMPGLKWRRVDVFGEDRRRTDDPGTRTHAEPADGLERPMA